MWEPRSYRSNLAGEAGEAADPYCGSPTFFWPHPPERGGAGSIRSVHTLTSLILTALAFKVQVRSGYGERLWINGRTFFGEAGSDIQPTRRNARRIVAIEQVARDVGAAAEDRHAGVGTDPVIALRVSVNDNAGKLFRFGTRRWGDDVQAVFHFALPCLSFLSCPARFQSGRVMRGSALT